MTEETLSRTIGSSDCRACGDSAINDVSAMANTADITGRRRQRAFAAYHELTSGESVKEVVLDDGAGHKASTKGQEELFEACLIRVDGDRAQITEDGEEVLAKMLNAIRQATSG